MEAITREEKLMSAASSGKSSGIKPITREEMFLSYIAGESKKKPKPITRKEMFLDKIEKGEGGGTSGSGDIVPLLEGTIEEITIPNEVTKLRVGGFVGCDDLREINADESHEVYASADGILYTKDGKKLVSYPPAKEETEYIMPDNVEEVESMAFNNTTTLEKVILSDNLKSLPENLAIENKNADIEIVLNPDILAQGDVYPVGNPLITTVTIPEGSTYLSATAFDNMPNIKTLYYNGECEFEIVGVVVGKTTYNYTAINKLSNLKNLVVDGSVKNIPDKFTVSDYSGLPSLESVIIGDSVETIGSQAFQGCANLREVTIGNNVKTIGYGAFKYSSNIQGTVMIPDSVVELKTGDYGSADTFLNCVEIKEVVIGKGLTNIPLNTFANCHGLTDITIPNNIISIDASAFSGGYDFTIHGYAGSYAETFATENNINFEVIE